MPKSPPNFQLWAKISPRWESFHENPWNPDTTSVWKLQIRKDFWPLCKLAMKSMICCFVTGGSTPCNKISLAGPYPLILQPMSIEASLQLNNLCSRERSFENNSGRRRELFEAPTPARIQCISPGKCSTGFLVLDLCFCFHLFRIQKPSKLSNVN